MFLTVCIVKFRKTIKFHVPIESKQNTHMTTLLYVFTLVNSTSDSVVVVVVVKKGRQGMKVAKKENGKDVPL